MTSAMNFWDAPVWNFVLTLTYLLIAMMVANILIQTVPLIRRMMIPSSVLGGFLILFVHFIFRKVTGVAFLDRTILEILTYHGLGLGFVAMTLQTTKKVVGKERSRDVFNTSCIVVSSYLIQAVIGIGITVALSFVLKNFAASGFLVPLGYGQGPGQAYNWGKTYETLWGFKHGTSFGLTVAAMGFVSASIGGIIYLNVMRRKGRLKHIPGEGGHDQTILPEDIASEKEIPLSDSMDKMTVQLALVFIGYAIGYLGMILLNSLIETGVLGNFGFNTIQPLIWGFNFLFGVAAGTILKKVLGGLTKAGIVKRSYTNDFMQSRIAGVMFDLMVVASIASIDLSAFQYPEFIIPLILVCVAAAAVTYVYLNFVCKKIYPSYKDEAWLSLYGMLTGTASTGVILLREVDPLFKTPASDNLILQNLWSIIFGAPMLLLLGVAPQGLKQVFMCLGIVAVLFVVMTVILFRRQIFKKKKAQ